MVIELLSFSEVFSVAMNLEESGIKFYTQMQEKVKNPKIKNLFVKLAEAEKEHCQTFKKMREEYTKNSPTPSDEFDELEKTYLKNLVETGVFYDPNYLPGLTLKNLTESDVLSIGIQTEKDSILFYTAASEKSPNSLAKNAFQKIIEEEKKHLSVLYSHLGEIKK